MSSEIDTKGLDTAILFLIFNRLDTTKKVFNEIKKVKPKKLYIASDGARIEREFENDKVQLIRQFVLNNIDWECSVKTRFRDKNLGCKVAVSDAIDWFFSCEESGIILEDDCLPSQSFFWYCQELLEKYKDENNIFMISGDNFQNNNTRGTGSYYFSNFPHIWGWATWRRSWDLYDVDFINHNKLNDIKYPDIIYTNPKYKHFWYRIYNLMKTVNTWDYQLSFTMFKYNKLCIIPNINLITNIGFGNEATHTNDENDVVANLEKYEFDSLVHPSKIEVNIEADMYSANRFFNYEKPKLSARIINKIKNLIS